MAENAAQLSEKVPISTHGNEKLTTQITPKFQVEPRRIKRLIENNGAGSVTVEFVDGAKKQEKFLVHSPLTSVQGPFVAQLGIATTPTGDILLAPRLTSLTFEGFSRPEIALLLTR